MPAIAGSMSVSHLPSPIQSASSPNIRFAQLTVRQTLIVRVPVQQNEAPVKWVEKGSRKCVNVDSIAGANVSSPKSIDLILKGGERWRLKFREECRVISFYRGFYIRPGENRQICAKRDVIHLRSGGECEIQTFKRLKLETDD